MAAAATMMASADDQHIDIPLPCIPLVNPIDYTPELCTARVTRDLIANSNVAALNIFLPADQRSKLTCDGSTDPPTISMPDLPWPLFHDCKEVDPDGLINHYVMRQGLHGAAARTGMLHLSAALCKHGFNSTTVFEQASNLIQSLQKAVTRDCNCLVMEMPVLKASRFDCALHYTFYMVYLRKHAPDINGVGQLSQHFIDTMHGDDAAWDEASRLYAAQPLEYLSEMRDIALQNPLVESQAIALAKAFCSKLHSGFIHPCIFLSWLVHLHNVGPEQDSPGRELWELFTIPVRTDPESTADHFSEEHRPRSATVMKLGQQMLASNRILIEVGEDEEHYVCPFLINIGTHGMR
ncbi:hypothetical protein WJX73_010505 [Symbiochloris irregularis]|uniref:Uncharacterized protein n=1 Tax=Symbiochloris irregularis TaxID=706552 RepID=A0AAW1PRT1_9CHLO